jgi:hypothetical protein
VYVPLTTERKKGGSVESEGKKIARTPSKSLEEVNRERERGIRNWTERV